MTFHVPEAVPLAKGRVICPPTLTWVVGPVPKNVPSAQGMFRDQVASTIQT